MNTPLHDDPLQQHLAELREPNPLLREAAESLYERRGNPYSNPEAAHGVINTKYWRHHEAVDFSHEATSSLVDAMVAQDYAPANSPYKEGRRSAHGGLKIQAEDKILFHRTLSQNLKHDLVPHAQEIVLLHDYRDALKARTNDLSPTVAEKLTEVNAALSSRCGALAQTVGDAIERCNVKAFPAQVARVIK